MLDDVGEHRTRAKGVVETPRCFFRPHTKLAKMITFNDYFYGHNAHESWTRMATETADGIVNAFRDAFSDDIPIRHAINSPLEADTINCFGPPTIRVPGRIPRWGEPRRLDGDWFFRHATDGIDFMEFFER